MLSRLTGFVCPTVSMVTTGHATGVEKTLFEVVIAALHRVLKVQPIALLFSSTLFCPAFVSN